MLENIIFTANIVTPVFLIILLGYFLKRIGIINKNFVTITSRFVFNVSLPALIFMKLYNIDLSSAIDLIQILYIYIGTLVMFFIIWFVSILFIKEGKDLSAFVQGAYRGNLVIVGLAIISNLYGNDGIGKASLILAFMLPLYNVLAVIILTVPMEKVRSEKIKGIIFNPIILAVIFALPFSYFNISIPRVLNTTGNFLAEVALPLALIGIGGSLNFGNIKKASFLAFTSSAIKLIAIPVVLTFGAYQLGYTGLDLGIMFILFACPTAIVSFIMADAMGCNSKLAGDIVIISTIGSIFTISVAIIFLKSIELI